MTASLPTLDDLRIEPGLPTIVSPRGDRSFTLEAAAPLLRDIASNCIERRLDMVFLPVGRTACAISAASAVSCDGSRIHRRRLEGICRSSH